ncbi:NACHT domain-containing protein [[Limnothrix rosea] IAM M-220]|uniref:NACHT domain-containing protein n=1 Tax=[Limnothrix rosea] IAM M-220 TaxID=454133 RepID=UPI000965D784|nr:HEAT repeat domain-containing protein [[Limnothrix rosea] IAM M-220]OKH17435.1 NTPase (NACHT family) [[Limnothrix rosea] IAM M-220]
MLEWVAATTGIELGKLVLEQILDLSKPVLEGYVRDFFKDCLSSGVSRLSATALKTPMAEAVGYFIKRFIKELQINDVYETSIQHHYKAVIKKFVQDKSVRPILGKAFEKDCKQIDYGQLEQIWAQQYQVSGWQFPSKEFDWRGVCKEYVYEVKGIVKANPELRSLLETDLLEDIARNTAQLSPGFDVKTYRASLQSSYGYLKLYTLDSTDRVDAIKLWAMFIEQTVREALPPMRYDLPLDLKRQLQAEGQLEVDLSPEALKHYRHEYFQQPARKVLEVVADSHRAVILGDPGSGKSSLLQYLALEWVDGNTERLPLLIELREFAINPSVNFLEFLHRGQGVDWQFDQQQLHQHLLESSTLVMFDGLDEVFDRPTQSTVIDDIIRFSQQYPKAQVIVTSRIIGYNPDRLQNSSFRHFTIQSLDTDEIHEFIERWYDLSMGRDPDKVRLKQRLKDAIANSKAIANLADNPLLLTMMVILNRRQELPRDRADLYDQASRVLLYHWDVDHKRLQIPMDSIGRREKQEMLRLIAYEMQAGKKGLKGNLISADQLTRILTEYLRDQGFSEPREKASRLIQQLRERNFILCYRGADTYGFMHRTFLEYFCAIEIVHRFEKQRTLTFEELRDKVFGQRWQDETWHEVLRLICGAIDPKFSAQIIQFLMEVEIDRTQFLDDPNMYRPPDNYLKREAIGNLTLASQCLMEIKNRKQVVEISEKLLMKFQDEVDNQLPYPFGADVARVIADNLTSTWQGNIQLTEWLKNGVESDKDWHWFVRRAVFAIACNSGKDSNTLNWLKKLVQEGHSDWGVCESAVNAVAQFWKENSDTLPWLKDLVQHHKLWAIRRGAMECLVRYWKNDPDALPIVVKIAQSDENWATRHSAVETLSQYWGCSSDLSDIFSEIAVNDPGGEKGYLEGDPRCAALEALITHYPTYPKTIKLLRDHAINDPDEQLREWAQEQLKIHDAKIKMEANSDG